MKQFSIIIPIFNVEDYIKKCFANIYSQGIDDEYFEIIAVNDGTQDNSMRYVDEYSKLHNNIIVINKPNGGVSSARNVGIENASGKYVVFLDPDDYFAPNSLLAIKDEVKQQDADFFVLRSHRSRNMSEAYSWLRLFKDKCIISGKEAYKAGYIRGSVCGCIFNRIFIENYNLSFLENARNCEDTMFFFLCQMYASTVVFLNREFYVVYERDSSASRSMSDEKILLMFSNLDYVSNYASQNDITDELSLDMLETLKYLLISNLTYFAIWYNGKKSLKLLKKNGIVRYLPINVKLGPISDGINKLYVFLINNLFSLYFYLRLLKFKK